ncbi:OmpA family protein [Pseudomonas sp. dw_358]|uniref:OmpA family protein n=1 Tax=Pseudomonas sp. dw_358 TaxID=2720083 RepID=UPI001BD337C4|nr:OmpA family protein [Pseudomonas sp. dw_358]
MSAYKTLALAVCLAAAGCAQTPQNQSAQSGPAWWPFGAQKAADKVADKDVEKAVNDKVAKSDAQSAEQNHWWWPFADEKKAAVPAGPVAAAVIPMPDPKVTQAWLDSYEPRVREAIKGSTFKLERRDNVLVVVAPVDSSFNPNRPAMLLPVTLGPITNVAKVLETDPHTAVLVLGHADTTGAADVNQKVSQERAQSVAAIFRLSGLQRNRLNLLGMGSVMPRAANDSPQGRALNRRVEIILTQQETMLALVSKYSQPTPPVAEMVAIQDVQAVPPVKEKAGVKKKAVAGKKAPAKTVAAKKKPATAKKPVTPVAKKKTDTDLTSN